MMVISARYWQFTIPTWACPGGIDDLQAKGGEIGIEGSEQEGEEGDVEEREGLVGDMGGDHQADSVSERKTNVEDPGDQVLVENLG